MKQKLLSTFILALGLCLYANSQSVTAGWADVQTGTTGGEGGQTVTPSTRAQFVAYASSTAPLIIRVRDTIELNLYERVKVRSNKTIMGITHNAMLRYGGLDIVGDNVIVQNLIIRDSYDGDWDGKTHSTDAITIAGKNVWVDHCWLAASADGLLDIRSNNDNEIGDFVTVSYTRFSDHNKVSLIGSSDDNVRDRDHLNSTFHHCWFDGTLEKGLNQRLPRIRYGSVHMYNNYFENIDSYCTLARIESDVVVENNYYRNANNPHGLEDFGLGEKDPELVAMGNIYDFSSGNKNTSGDAFVPADFYTYEAMDASLIPAHVMNEAGPFNNPSNHAPVAVPDTVVLEKGDRSFELNLTLNDYDEDGDDLRIATIINDIKGAVLIRDNILRYIAPSNRDQPDTVLYELVDTEGGYAIGTLVVHFDELTTSSATETLELEGFKVFPNPARDWITVNFSHPSIDEFELKVTDLLGRTVYRQQIKEIPGNQHQIQVPCETLEAAYYLISIVNKQAVASRKILIR